MINPALLVILSVILSSGSAFAGNIFYVATDGEDVIGNGTLAQPWASITFALDQVSDGSVIRVRPGLYEGRIRIRGVFATGVRVESEVPYLARLRHNATVITAFENAQGITLSGFDVAHDGPGASGLVLQIQDSNADQSVRNLIVENNILHDSFNNDILKINNGATDILVRGNLFYNQQGSDEHIDINSVERVDVVDNVFFNDFAASGRTNNNDTSSYIVIKDSNGSDDAFTGSRSVSVRRNIFFSWEGSAGANFVLCGEDGQPFFEAEDIAVENNLLIGNSNNVMRAPFGVKGCRDVSFRANTISGNLPANAYAMRLNREGANLQLQNIEFYNNIWSDPSGSMNDFSDTPPSDTASFVLNNNGYWNGGAVLPENAGDLINPSDDNASIVDDFGLPALDGLSNPFWQPVSQTFNGGYTSIREAFVDIAVRFGQLSSDSSAIDQANASQMPDNDLLGQPRDSLPDIGALERQNGDLVFLDGFESSFAF